MSSQLEAMTGVTAAQMTMAGVAALSNDLSPIVYGSANPQKLEELRKKYGQWAVKSAIAACPLGDLKCIEREAQRLSQVRQTRRQQ